MVQSAEQTPTSAVGLAAKFRRNVLRLVGCRSVPVGVDRFAASDEAEPSETRWLGPTEESEYARDSPTVDVQTEERQLMRFREKLAASRAPEKTDFDGMSPSASRLSPALKEITLNPVRSNEPLHAAVATGKPEEVELVLEQIKGDADLLSSALHTAAQIGGQEVVCLLLDKGANIGATDKNGWTPLHHAALQGHLRVVEQLLEAGADVHCLTDDGMTPLHCTVHLRNCVQAGETTARMKHVMRLLIDSGADVNAKDHQGWTPLHVAVQSGSIELLQVLLKSGADVQARDKAGNLPVNYTPVSRGLYHQNRDMQRLLKLEMEGSCRSQTLDVTSDNNQLGGQSEELTPKLTTPGR